MKLAVSRTTERTAPQAPLVIFVTSVTNEVRKSSKVHCVASPKCKRPIREYKS